MTQAVSTIAGDFVNVSETYVLGAAVAIGAGPAAPWVIGTEGQPWHYTGATTTRAWREVTPPLPCAASRIATSPEGTPWVIDVAHRIWRLDANGSCTDESCTPAWESLPSPAPTGLNCASDIGVGAGNVAWAVGCDDDKVTGSTIFQWNDSARTWTPFPSNRANRIAVSPEGTVWFTDDQHNVYQPTLDGPVKIPGAAARAISVGPNDTAWILAPPTGFTTDTQPLFWNGSTFVRASSTFGTEISVGSDGTPWMVATNHNIFRWAAPWVSLGPNSGFALADKPSIRFSGDVEDIDATDLFNNRVVVGTGGGGVWVLNPSVSPNSPAAWTNISDTKFGPGPSPAIASLAQLPGDPFRSLVVATGVTSPADADSFVGNGIWRGAFVLGQWFWNRSSCNGKVTNCPTNFTKIRYSPANSNIVYASSLAADGIRLFGFYISTDGGATFVNSSLINQIDTVTDFALDPDGNHVYAAVKNVGIEVSTDGGRTFVGPPIAPLPANQFGFVKLAIAPSDPTIMYADVVDPADHFEGVFQGTQMRTNPTWSGTQMNACTASAGCMTPTDRFLQTQSGHNEAIAVSLFDPNIVIVAGVQAWVTTTAGTQGAGSACSCAASPSGWTIASPLIHGDVHTIAFGLSAGIGEFIFLGSDGGIYQEAGTSGTNWSNSINTIPVMQEEAISVHGDEILASAWDVGAQFSLDHGTTWAGQSTEGADTNGALIVSNPNQPIQWLTSNPGCRGVPSGPNFGFSECMRFNSGSPQNAWTQVSIGSTPVAFTQAIRPSGQFGNQPANLESPMVADDSDGIIYTLGALIPPLANAWVGVLQWNASGFQGYGPRLPFPPTWITKFNFGTNTPPIVIAGGFPAAPQGGPNLQISIGGAAWSEIGGLLPTDIIRVVTDRPLDNEVYVLTASGRVFAKPQSLVAMGDNGLWTELTGNLTVAGSNGSAVFFNTILGDPFHYSVFVGTSNGVYKTTNNCVRTKRTCVWQPWGDGLPVHPASVEANGTITSIANGDPGTAVHQLVGQVRSDGRYYVYAATWERGVWVRDAMGDDP